MKAKAILINWAPSLFAAGSIVAEHSHLRAVLLVAGWFCASSLLLKYAEKKGWMDFIKID
jgi:hypothetical protein